MTPPRRWIGSSPRSIQRLMVRAETSSCWATWSMANNGGTRVEIVVVTAMSPVSSVCGWTRLLPARPAVQADARSGRVDASLPRPSDEPYRPTLMAVLRRSRAARARHSVGAGRCPCAGLNRHDLQAVEGRRRDHVIREERRPLISHCQPRAFPIASENANRELAALARPGIGCDAGVKLCLDNGLRVTSSAEAR
jgi:hypothetical protein